MNEVSEEDDLTVPCGLVLDLVEECRHLGAVAQPLIKMTRHLDPQRPEDRCSLDVFNDASDWIERELGMTSVRLSGRQIGHRIFAAMRGLGLSETPTTLQLLRQLEGASRSIVRDAEGHGWDLMRHDQLSAVMRNTQELNCILLEGVMLSLLERTSAVGCQVKQVACTRLGDDACDFELSWTGLRAG